MTPLETAIRASQLGISTWPPKQDKSKKPDGAWKRGQEHVATEDEIRAQYARGRTGVGFICGAVSGGLECLDFDDRATWSEYQTSAKRAGMESLLARVVAGYLEHSPNGAHLLYRCSEIAGNTKLAQRKLSGVERKSLIETRGEGGYIIAAPSHGSVNKNGDYVLISGGLESIVTLTPDERKALHDLAHIFDECLTVVDHRPARDTAHDGTRPGDEYAAKVTWAEILEPHGWLALETRNGVTMWRRPGKDIGEGSATTNHGGSDLLYVFSTSTCFEPNRGINKFSAYATLNHGGDFSAAASALALEGYGVEVPEFSPEDIAELIRNSKASAAARALQAAKETEAKPPSVSELLSTPGVLGEFMAWVDDCSPKPQPVLALGSGLCAMGALLGRRVRSWGDVRTNLYAIGVGESGCGKDAARKAINRWFHVAGIGQILGDDLASGAAIEAAVLRCPSRLFLIDELGHYLARGKGDSAPAHARDVPPTLMRIYSSSASIYRRREYAAKAKRDDDGLGQFVDQPCLCLYGTTVPGPLTRSLTRDQLDDGFLGRFLFFESQDPDPTIRDIDCPPEPPKVLIDWAKGWQSMPTNPEAKGNIEKRETVAPLRIMANAHARDVLRDAEETFRARRSESRADGGGQGLWVRTREAAIKLALITACGRLSGDRPEITEADARWGSGLAWALTANLAALAERSVVVNATEDNVRKVLEIVRGAGEISRSDLTRRTQWVIGPQREQILATLVESKQVVAVTDGEGKHKRTRYIASSHDHFKNRFN